MQEGQYELDLNIQGRAFTESSSSLSSAIEILKGYESSYAPCLKMAAEKYSSEEFRIASPPIGLVYSRGGSLLVKTVIELAELGISLAPHAPAVLSYGLNLYKAASKLVAMATEHFNRTNEPVNVTVTNSPGTTITVIATGHGDITISDPNVLNAAKKIHEPLDKMAKQIKEGHADSIDVLAYTPEDEEVKALTLDNDNKNNFRMPSKTTVTDRFLELKCAIYSFNKRTGKGLLEFLEEDYKEKIHFEIQDVDSDLLIEAMSSVYSEITFNSEMTVNALGETKIIRVYIHNIVNHSQDPEESPEPSMTM